jgi:ribosomal protein L30E
MQWDREGWSRGKRKEGGEARVGGETRWNRWTSCEISAPPGLMWVCRTYASRKHASRLLDHSVNCCVLFTTKSVLGCRDTVLQILLSNAKFTILLANTRGTFASKVQIWFKKAASKMIDNSVNSYAFFTTKTALKCGDIGL